MKISTILDHIDSGHMALPEFQRGYVWGRDQVRSLVWSLYKRYPVGSLLTWVTESIGATHRGDQELAAGVIKLLLDGQQRMTSLYGIIRGKPPAFFDGDANAFTGLYFNIKTEEFSFYMPTKMDGNPLWIGVTQLMQENINPFVTEIASNPELTSDFPKYVQRLTHLYNIRDIEFFTDEVTGEDKTIDVVVDIFNRVNSGGTKLSKGDLALAKICSTEPAARASMRKALEEWRHQDYTYFKLDWLLRNVTTTITGEARFNAIHEVSAELFNKSLKTSLNHINRLLDIIAARLGLDHGRVLFGYFAFPVLARYLAKREGEPLTEKETNTILFWYIQTAMWGRYSGSTETVLARDLAILEGNNNSVDALIEELKLWRGSLKVVPEHFNSWSKGARFYPVLYMLTRVGESIDWGMGIPLKKGLLGKNSSLEVHHIFPRALLKKHGYDKTQINAVANYCFLTKDTNIKISDKDPAVYFEAIEKKHPGALASQWIPMDRSLWDVEKYPEFLAERRRLLAAAANGFLNELYEYDDISTIPPAPLYDKAPGGIETDDEELLLKELQVWIQQNQLLNGEVEYELIDSLSGEHTATVDLAWPDGLQAGLSNPVAVALNESPSTVKRITDGGFICFESITAFKEYVALHILGDVYYGLPEWARRLDESDLNIARHIVKKGIDAPDVGYEAYSGDGALSSQIQLAWPSRKVGIVKVAEESNPSLDGWYILPINSVLESPHLLDVALGEG